ncbi:MAG: CPBP family intramembrane metalloprotease [Flavobacteriales bacterium]|nr:CPBP family intramembrane metalloprotease [Flavobacteriales bacterium]
MQKAVAYILTLLTSFAAFFWIKEAFFAKGFHFFESFLSLYPLSFFLIYALVGVPTFVFVYLANERHLLEPLGLRGNVFRAVVLAFVFSMPMMVGYGLPSGFRISIDGREFWFGCVFAAFFEELYYRGFFFGQLYRKTKLGFFPALIVPALIFASLHLYQSQDLATLVGIFITTFMGAGLFAWLYCEWNYNLWVPIFLHFFMNLSWSLFDDVADNALGDVNANIYRALTILLAIGGTLVYKRRMRIPLAINKTTLLLKK